MSKMFYTEKDIEDMFATGATSLEVSDSVVLTELAYEKARSLGMALVQTHPDNPPCAPVRPYLSRVRSAQPADPLRVDSSGRAASRVNATAARAPDGLSLQERIRNAVIARLGSQVDSNLLEVIIRRVLTSTGTKEPVCCLAESGVQPCVPSSTPAPKG